MTIEERLDRLEHFTAGFAEQARKDHEENRQLWRETQREILLLSRRVTELAEQSLRVQEQLMEFQKNAEERDRIIDERFRQTDEKFRQTDERIQTLVSAIGEYIRGTRPGQGG